jgi:hypothetical protein
MHWDLLASVVVAAVMVVVATVRLRPGAPHGSAGLRSSERGSNVVIG